MIMHLKEKTKYTCIEGLSHLFLKKNSKIVELTLQFKKTKAICEGVLIFFFTSFVVIFRFR
jgi:hypothetical protein